MEKIKIRFCGGESRRHSHMACDYALAVVQTTDGDEYELYAETLETSDDRINYDLLRQEIISLADDLGIPAEAFE